MPSPKVHVRQLKNRFDEICQQADTQRASFSQFLAEKVFLNIEEASVYERLFDESIAHKKAALQMPVTIPDDVDATNYVEFSQLMQLSISAVHAFEDFLSKTNESLFEALGALLKNRFAAGMLALDFTLLDVADYQREKSQFKAKHQAAFSDLLKRDPGFLDTLKRWLSEEGLSVSKGEFSVQAIFDSFFEGIETALNEQSDIFDHAHNQLMAEVDLHQARLLLLDLKSIVSRRSELVDMLERFFVDQARVVKSADKSSVRYTATQKPRFFDPVQPPGGSADLNILKTGDINTLEATGIDFTPPTPRMGPSSEGRF